MPKEECWLAVDKDGTEKVSSNKPIRRQFKGERIFSTFWGLCKGSYSKNHWNKWCNGWSNDESDFLPFMGSILPRGSIEKLIGYKLTWENDPVELNSIN